MKRLFSTVTALALLAIIGTGAACAQGSTGGAIGNRGKSVSGGAEESAPQKRTTRPSGDDASRRSASITGTWRWSATCERANFAGTMTFEQTGNTFSARHGETNMWDTGTVTDGRISGGRVTFTRQWGPYVDRANLRLSGTRMSGVTPNTAHSGRCELNFSKLDR
jgi:hypothetical protein